MERLNVRTFFFILMLTSKAFSIDFFRVGFSSTHSVYSRGGIVLDVTNSTFLQIGVTRNYQIWAQSSSRPFTGLPLSFLGKYAGEEYTRGYIESMRVTGSSFVVRWIILCMLSGPI